jgi:glycosyltransferase involved in cell wall biosynthesis
VERVAHGLVSALAEHFLDGNASLICGQATLRFCIAVPHGFEAKVPARIGCIPVVAVGAQQGHMWEQIDLARLPEHDWLISLCNTGPMLRRKHGLMFHDAQVYAIPANFNWKFRLWYRLVLNIAGRRAAFLLTNSRFSQKEIARYTGISSDQMTVVYPGVDHVQPDIKNDSSDEISRVPRRPFVLAVSSVNPNKNFGAVVRALELMGSDAPECVVVGPLNNTVFESAKLDLAKVTYLGYVRDETLIHLYQHALCLVFPSHYEGFGLPPIEAMRAGCSVVVSQTSCLPEVCGDAALYCDPARPQTLADAIASLIQSPAKVALLRQLGKQHAQQYTWRGAAAKMVERLKMAIESSDKEKLV